MGRSVPPGEDVHAAAVGRLLAAAEEVAVEPLCQVGVDAQLRERPILRVSEERLLHLLRPGAAPLERRHQEPVDGARPVAGARLRRLVWEGFHLVPEQLAHELRDGDVAEGVVLGRLPVPVAAVLVELPLHANQALVRTAVLPFEADHLAEPEACVVHRDAGDELLVPTTQQRHPFGQQQRAERVGGHPLPSTGAFRPSGARAAAAVGLDLGGVGGEVSRLDRVGAQGVERGAVSADGRLGVPGGPLDPLELGDLLRGDVGEQHVRPHRTVGAVRFMGEEVVLQVVAQAASVGDADVLERVPGVRPLAEGDAVLLAEAPGGFDYGGGGLGVQAHSDLGFLLCAPLLGVAFASPSVALVIAGRGGVGAVGCLVADAVVVAVLLGRALLHEGHGPLLLGVVERPLRLEGAYLVRARSAGGRRSVLVGRVAQLLWDELRRPGPELKVDGGRDRRVLYWSRARSRAAPWPADVRMRLAAGGWLYVCRGSRSPSGTDSSHTRTWRRCPR